MLFPVERDERDFSESCAAVYCSSLCAKPKNRTNSAVGCLPWVVKYCRTSSLPPVSLFRVMSQTWGEDVFCIVWCGTEIPLKKRNEKKLSRELAWWLLQKLLQYLLSLNYVTSALWGNFKLSCFQFNELLWKERKKKSLLLPVQWICLYQLKV